MLAAGCVFCHISLYRDSERSREHAVLPSPLRPPCGEGSGGGITGTVSLVTSLPSPPPQGGEGAHRRCGSTSSHHCVARRAGMTWMWSSARQDAVFAHHLDQHALAQA